LRNNLVNESPQNAFVEANDNVTGMPILERIMNLEKKFLLLKQKLTQKC
jgi:hypothetical protein